jgi:hypothetical protein
MGKSWLCIANISLGLAHRTVWWRIGQCPVVHRTVSGDLGCPTMNWLLSGIDGVVRL